MIERTINLEYQHRVLFTRGVFEPGNETLSSLFEPGGKNHALVFLDTGVVEGNPGLVEKIESYFDALTGLATLVATPVILPGGERSKNDWHHVRDIWEAISNHNICRQSYTIAIGGGAILDLVGFASATAHRGIRHLRMPTTSLSQGDGGVGVKNGVNYFGKKNWVGTFSVPHAIINDLDFLSTLPEKEKRAGLIEAIKVALIRDAEFYKTIEGLADSLSQLEESALELVIRRSAEQHVDHIATAGDPFELGSARPLDFGHWVAHKLEQVSNFRIGHGEAVAIGIAVDLLYSVRIGLLDASTAECILDLIERVGFHLYAEELLLEEGSSGELVILRGLEEFREHLGGQLTITLVPEIGSKLEVHEMNLDSVRGALMDLEQRAQVAN